ncbi:alanine/ornithine racemase family PLP-dependent enzyme [Anoxybacillus flavithermus]|uniref:alanine/ornithine racemase family PLP-dependent enzyme n=1 Tax=Anoxybacillus flavithermus TaxID=33934 RepID=UPI001868F53A|nr:alanine/ornithine racemase family PLP-dependent enzyme [Anoxybacillus flavithermus]MBE2932723.1 alanine/ornithine racemase family PLP-dependent enzyme [Anoxybacillus flavithermus]
MTAKVEIDLRKIRHNAKTLKKWCEEKGIQMTAVIKGVNGDMEIARALVDSGITSLADTKVERIAKLKSAQIPATYMLIRTPALSEVSEVVRHVDVSAQSEIDVVRAISAEAVKQNKTHAIIVMVEMGDLREGVMPKDVPAFIEQILQLPNIQVVGIGANFACFGGIIPTEQKMRELSSLAKHIQKEYSLFLPYVSGGNSANYYWLKQTKDVGCINHLRLGEAIFLGRETIRGAAIAGLYQDAFCFVAEVIEVKTKPSVPYGVQSRNAFGEAPTFPERGMMKRAIVGIGRQDVYVNGLTPLQPVQIIGSSSDHMIVDATYTDIQVGDHLRFAVDYGAMISLMTSPHVQKTYVQTDEKNGRFPTKTSA